ncbi:hypothetical protein SAMN04487770_12021 [Butyrivibrio sp. ob235]|nr:hypothetical protein SAMN04487770_12021 [Butyrivibrio sp. ob235]
MFERWQKLVDQEKKRQKKQHKNENFLKKSKRGKQNGYIRAKPME